MQLFLSSLLLSSIIALVQSSPESFWNGKVHYAAKCPLKYKNFPDETYCKTGDLDKAFKTLVANKPLKKGTFLTSQQVTENYELTFSIKPTAIVHSWGSIIHFTSTGKDCCEPGSRIPGIWFSPSSTKLYVRVGTLKSGDWGIASDYSLPLKKTSKVSVIVYKGKLNVYVNKALVASAQTPEKRPSGLAQVYMSDPTHSPAKAVLNTFSFKNLKSDPFLGKLGPDTPQYGRMKKD